MIFSRWKMVAILLLLFQGTLFGQVASKQLASQQFDLTKVKFSTDPELLAESEQAMLRFAAARQDLPAKFAFFVRGETWRFGERAGMQRWEKVCLGARNETAASADSQEPIFYYAVGSRIMQCEGGQLDFSQQLRITIWRQFLRVGLKTYFRNGAGNHFDHFENLDTDATQELTLGMKPNANVDFFVAPLFSNNNISRSEVPKSHLTYYVRGGAVKAARVGKKLVVVWQFRGPTGEQGGFSVVTFDDESGGMPIRHDSLFQRRNETADEVVDRCKVIGTLQTEWHQEATPGGKRFLPVKIEGSTITEGGGGSTDESVWYIQWKFGDEAADAIPTSLTDKSRYWQEGVLNLFGQHAELPHEQFVEAWGKSRVQR